MTITRHYHKIAWHFLGHCVALALQLSSQSKHLSVLESPNFDDSGIMTGMMQLLRHVAVMNIHCS